MSREYNDDEEDRLEFSTQKGFRQRLEELEDILSCVHEAQIQHAQLLRELQQLSKRHVEIAERYEKHVGEPMERLIKGVNMIYTVIVWAVGSILTIFGLQQAWEWIVKNKIR